MGPKKQINKSNEKIKLIYSANKLSKVLFKFLPIPLYWDAGNTNGYSDRPTCAHSRIPIDLIVSGISMRLFQASQIASMIAS